MVVKTFKKVIGYFLLKKLTNFYLKNKAFGHASLNDINEKFSDIGDFCLACSKLLVNEISKRVHDDLGNFIKSI